MYSVKVDIRRECLRAPENKLELTETNIVTLNFIVSIVSSMNGKHLEPQNTDSDGHNMKQISLLLSIKTVL